MTISTVFFDLAGVLLRWDSKPLYEELFPDAPDTRNYFVEKILTTERLTEIATGRKLRIVLSELKSVFPDYSHILEFWWERWDEMINADFPMTVDIAKRLRQTGIKTPILGNWSVEEFHRAKKRFNFLNDFSPILISGNLGIMKPDPAIFHQALTACGVEPCECVFVDDTFANIQAAKRIGITGLQFVNPPQLEKDLLHLGLKF